MDPGVELEKTVVVGNGVGMELGVDKTLASK
jgi:hypothetical protein